MFRTKQEDNETFTLLKTNAIKHRLYLPGGFYSLNLAEVRGLPWNGHGKKATSLLTADGALTAWKGHRRDLCKDMEIALAGACVKVNKLRGHSTSLSRASDERHTSASPGAVPHFHLHMSYTASKRSLNIKAQCSLAKPCYTVLKQDP